MKIDNRASDNWGVAGGHERDREGDQAYLDFLTTLSVTHKKPAGVIQGINGSPFEQSHVLCRVTDPSDQQLLTKLLRGDTPSSEEIEKALARAHQKRGPKKIVGNTYFY